MRRRPKACWGPAPDQHAAGCHPARPLCRYMRKRQAAKYGVCECGTPPYPHRRGYCKSGAALRYMNAAVHGPAPDAPGLAKVDPGDVEDVFAFFDALASGQKAR